MSNPNSRIAPKDDAAFDVDLFNRFKDICLEINQIRDMKVQAFRNSDVVPTYDGADDQIVWKTGRTEQGTTPNKYVISGWQWVGGGWKEMRFYTGN